jgi:hypothetical protein
MRLLAWAMLAFVVSCSNLSHTGLRDATQPPTMPHETRTGPPTPDPRAACYQARLTMMQGVSNLAAQRRRGCHVDSDCILVETSLSCQEGCPLAILASARADYLKALASTDSEVCTSSSQTCRVGSLCAPIDGASCFQEQCVVKLRGVRMPDALLPDSRDR